MERFLVCVTVACLCTCSLVAAGQSKSSKNKEIRFVKGKWDPSEWTPILVAPQKQPVRMVQKADCIGTDAFSKDAIKAKQDNVVQVYDTGKPAGEFHLEFRIGFEPGSAPAIVLWPELEGNRLRKGIGVFVASYCMAVWEIGFDKDKNEVTYRQLARLGRYQDPAKNHVLRCRFAKNGNFTLQIDDSDYLMFRQEAIKANNLMGIWGCHGTCYFLRLSFPVKPQLPFGGVSKPRAK